MPRRARDAASRAFSVPFPEKKRLHCDAAAELR